MVPKLTMDSPPAPILFKSVGGNVNNSGPKDLDQTFEPGLNPQDETSYPVSISTKPTYDKRHDEGNASSQAPVSVPNNAPLYCSIKGRSHGSLLEWGIAQCPACKINLSPSSPPQTGNKGIPFETAKEPSETRDSSETKQSSRIEYKIKYLDSK